MYIKYPRTYHLPFSLGITSDDKMLKDISCFHNNNIVITEKMDGENITMTNDRIYARSIDSKNHISREYIKNMWGKIKLDIPNGWRICSFQKHFLNLFHIN